MVSKQIMENTLFNLLLICTLCVMGCTACEKEKRASAEIGALPKQTLDKVTNDLNKASALAAAQLKGIENENALENKDK